MRHGPHQIPPGRVGIISSNGVWLSVGVKVAYQPSVDHRDCTPSSRGSVGLLYDFKSVGAETERPANGYDAGS